tara:strand:- start:5381 stop:5569 length:189 start_codon:yes stop_codon:yes gene_type:complete
MARTKKQVVLGYVEVTYLTDHGSYEKGEKRDMPVSTAKALELHKVVKLGKELDEFIPKQAKL